jgi:O-antigen/teichoic acid export membrane protein
VAKVASLAFFVVMARELGEARFGDFTFAVSLTSLLIIASGFGTEDLIVREVARDRGRVHALVADAATVKWTSSIGLVALAVAIAWVAGYDGDALAAVALVGAGVACQNLSRTWYAAYQAYERMQYVALALIVERTLIAITGIALLVFADAGLAVVSAVFAAGSLLGLAFTAVGLRRWVVPLRWDVDRRRWAALVRAGIPIGLAYLTFTLLLRLDTVLLGVIAGGEDSSEVGVYGAAFRLLEGTFFVSAAIASAMLPWFAVSGGEDRRRTSTGFELGLKLASGVLMPVGIAFIALAEPIVDLLYGESYEEAVLPLRLLGVAAVTFGVNNVIATALTARDLPQRFLRIAAIVSVENIVLNLILIPPYGADATAFNAALSGLLLAVLSVREAAAFGGLNLLRAFAAPLVGGLAMAAVAAATGFALLPGLLLGGLAYAGAFALFERLSFPDDLTIVRDLARARGSALRPEPAGDAP